MQNRAPLQPNGYYLLPLTSVKPTGWLKRQLQTQAQGLSGHLEEFWPDLGPNSAWLGGSGEGWERGPYYLDGLVPLAYLLDDKELKAKAQKWVEWALTHQRPDGGIGPEKNKDWWPNMLALKALTQYQEATGDPRVVPFMQKYFAYQAARLPSQPLYEWAKFRWHDEIVTVLWLYNRTGDAKLLDLAKMLHDQGHDWKGQFANFQYKDKDVVVKKPNLATHGVNNGMALKADGLWWLVSGDKTDRDSPYRMLKTLDQYHGQPNGMFSCDEHYAGLKPTQGTELCTVVEEMYSLENLLAILGDARLGDRLEKISYNALPATFTGDMWAHQYDQQVNQIEANVAKRDWVNNKEDSNTFGLEPNFGCCTANLHQGWPKLAASLWMATPDGGLAAAAYAPSEVMTTVGKGVKVKVTEATDYPFREKVRLMVEPERATAFPLVLRIPAWATQASVVVNGKATKGVAASAFYTVKRTWKPGDVVEITFPMEVRTSTWYHNGLSVERGPLVMALNIPTEWRKIKDREQAPDWEALPRGAWNYALVAESGKLAGKISVEERPVGEFPFTPNGAPLAIRVAAKKVPDWTVQDNSAGDLPESPVQSGERTETVALIPYGAAKLRIAEFPWTQASGGAKTARQD